MKGMLGRKLLFAVSWGFVACGLALSGIYGWSYAKQTIWLPYEHLLRYQPKLPSHQPLSADTTHSRSLARVRESGAVKTSSSGWGQYAQTTRVSVVGQSSGPSARGTKRSAADQPMQIWSPLPKNGIEIGTLVMPSIHLSVPVVQGTSSQDLALGVGHDLATSLPGQGSNVFVAGHRDTVFSPLKYLKKGDSIFFKTPYGTFTYQATRFQIVPETDVALLAPTKYETLTISTCYPFIYFGHAPKRYIVYTKLVAEPPALAKK